MLPDVFFMLFQSRAMPPTVLPLSSILVVTFAESFGLLDVEMDPVKRRCFFFAYPPFFPISEKRAPAGQGLRPPLFPSILFPGP